MGPPGAHKVPVKPKPVKAVGNLDECFQKLKVESEEAQEYGGNQGQGVSSVLKSIIFGWTIQDMMNEKLLKSKVNSIPMKFPTPREYFDHFSWPLVEEIRAQLQQSMERLGETPNFRLISKREIIHRSQRSSKHKGEPRQLAVCIDTNPVILDATQAQEKKHSDFMLMLNDVILLSSVPPRDVKDIQRPGVLHFIASIEGLQPAAGRDSPYLHATVHVHSKNYNYEDLMERNRSWFVISLTGLTPHLRIWSALHGMNQTVPPIIEETLYSVALGQKVNVGLGNCKSASTTEKIERTIVEYCASFHLNESQTAAVVSIVSGLYHGKPPYVRMIQGPPGTGKTSVLVALLAVISSLNKKCLVCAPTNGAISLVAQRYMGLLKKGSEETQLTPICTVKQKKAAVFSPSIHLSDFVLVGNEGKLLLEGALVGIFLPYRAQRLLKALNPHTGWRAAAVSLLKFLESAKSQFKKLSQKKRNNNVNEIPTEKAENRISFLEYVSDMLPRLAKAVADHSNTLVDDLPSCLMEKSRLITISRLANRVADLVMEPGNRESDLFRWFSDTLPEVEPSSLNCMPDEQGDEGNFPETRKALAWVLCMDIKKFAKGPLESSAKSEMLIDKLCLKHSRLVFCTVCTAGRDSVRKAAPFDCAIIDEAAQLVEAETAIVTRIPGLTHAILIGDHQQLPATVISKVAAKSGYSRSLFERLQKLNHPSHLLNTQCRMHPSISFFPNAQFYKGRINDGENVKKQAQKVYQQKLYGTYAFIDVSDGIEQKNGQSLHNPVEAAVLIHIIKKLQKACSQNNISELSVGVITPYAGQVQAVSALWKTRQQQQQNGVNLEIKSVDGFQGQEMDIILFSAVRSNQSGDIGFLKDYRRLNVALTRARFCLWIVGNAKTLHTRDKVWRALVNNAKNRGSYIDSGKDAEIMEVIRKGCRKGGKSDVDDKNQPASGSKQKPAAQVSKRASKPIRVKKVSVSRVARTPSSALMHCSLISAGGGSKESNSGPEPISITATAHKLIGDEHVVAGASSRCSQVEQAGGIDGQGMKTKTKKMKTKKKKLKIVLRKDDRIHTPHAESSVPPLLETTHHHPLLQFINSHKLPLLSPLIF